MPQISRGHEKVGEGVLARIFERIEKEGDSAHGTVAEKLALARQLSEFPCGRWLLGNRGGLNGRWNHYVVVAPPPPADLENELEHFVLYRAPNFVASRERFGHFQEAIQAELHRARRLASIPCGVMADLLTLDYAGRHDIDLLGVDSDGESLALAAELAAAQGMSDRTTLRKADAWELRVRGQLDVIASHGLTMYEPSDERVAELYWRFAEALAPGGLLIISHITPPPSVDPSSPWRSGAYDPDSLRIQSLIFEDILRAQGPIFRTEAQLQPMFHAAGLKLEASVLDRAHICPTLLLRKRA